ncbi:hypothetical protein HID58_012090 [Brassica napus]|uniref:Non-specific lipid-transfer protein n=1 Tax=Brassica napus TaxID=3708 RepID=A0A816VZC8_BRANA|nr:hypothetical protein HID58_012090 [Brassica napus]CAF2129751.1 unnamed protein product [Brassica napus]
MMFPSKITTCILVLAVYTAAPSESTITCGTVTSTLARCIGYLTNSGSLPSDCCVGVKSLNQMAQTTPDRRQVCECLKSAAKDITGLNTDLVATLPTTCGVSVPYPIRFSTNCDTYVSITCSFVCFIIHTITFFFECGK